MKNFSKVIAIDGPSGSGKSTIAKLVAQKLGLTFLDTGAMYRAIGLHLDLKGISSEEVDKIQSELNKISFEYAPSKNVLVRLNDQDFSQKIREHHVSHLASKYSQVKIIRDFLVSFQRQIAGDRASILEGRDIGTIVFPHAALKFFLTADTKIRAKRRLDQLQEKNPTGVFALEDIQKDIQHRDEKDSERDIAPLVKTEDAIEVDTSTLSIEDVVKLICDKYQEKIHLFK